MAQRPLRGVSQPSERALSGVGRRCLRTVVPWSLGVDDRAAEDVVGWAAIDDGVRA